MSEQEFAPFVPSAEAVAVGTPEKPAKRKKEKKVKAAKVKKPAAAPAPAKAAEPAKPPRKKRAKKQRPMTVDITKAFVAMAGMKETDCEALEQLTHILAEQPKASRIRLVGALGKIFA